MIRDKVVTTFCQVAQTKAKEAKETLRKAEKNEEEWLNGSWDFGISTPNMP